MGPIRNIQGQDDDFVLTLSDDDQAVTELDDASTNSTTPPPPTNGKKRKRAENNREHANGKKHKRLPVKIDKGSGLNGENGGYTRADGDRTNSQPKGEDDGAMNSDFEFQTGDANLGKLDDFDGWGVAEPRLEERQRGDKKPVDIDEIIARRRQRADPRHQMDESQAESEEDLGISGHSSDREESFTAFDNEQQGDELLAPDGFGMGFTRDDEESEEGTESSSSRNKSPETSEAGDDDVAEHVPHPNDLAAAEDDDNEENGENDPIEAERRAAFFAPDTDNNGHKSSVIGPSSSFQGMSLSRPVLRGVAAVGFSAATPIQSRTIPIALLGKDVVGGAVTGSGKTAAFIIPILERLLYRPKKVAVTRVVILMPTRELAVQCFNVATKLASFTDITFVQLVGGYSAREQEQQLKKRPDIIIATPGRFIDHMLNTASFAIDTIEILVLDEADRMLEDGFADELDTILKTLPKGRQTMLFSATMTDSVDKLIRLGLSRPVRLMIDPKRQTVSGLVQEFVRLRPGKEDKRLAYLMYLCTEVYTEQVIIFFRQKKEAHRVRVIFSLCGLKASELHGSMSQEQRIQAVEAFRNGSSSFLLATDLASRGLDIRNITTVLNYSAPQSHDIYLHRVGRTARAGRTGRACTLAAEPDRKVVKEAVKAARTQGARIASRTVPAEKAEEWAERLEGLEGEVEEVLREEKEERVMAQAEMQVRKGDNLIKYEDEIMSRPKRTWFESEKDKRAAKERGRVELNGEEAGNKKKEKRKLSGKEKKALNDHDDRLGGGRIWKKGRAGRAGKGALENVGKGKKVKGKNVADKKAAAKNKRRG
ncbi:MAG: hypothetical protein Q9157_003232 [Trypethelium eluteriae]